MKKTFLSQQRAHSDTRKTDSVVPKQTAQASNSQLNFGQGNVVLPQSKQSNTANHRIDSIVFGPTDAFGQPVQTSSSERSQRKEEMQAILQELDAILNSDNQPTSTAATNLADTQSDSNQIEQNTDQPDNTTLNQVQKKHTGPIYVHSPMIQSGRIQHQHTITDNKSIAGSLSQEGEVIIQNNRLPVQLMSVATNNGKPVNVVVEPQETAAPSIQSGSLIFTILPDNTETLPIAHITAPTTIPTNKELLATQVALLQQQDDINKQFNWTLASLIALTILIIQLFYLLPI